MNVNSYNLYYIEGMGPHTRKGLIAVAREEERLGEMSYLINFEISIPSGGKRG